MENKKAKLDELENTIYRMEIQHRRRPEVRRRKKIQIAVTAGALVLLLVAAIALKLTTDARQYHTYYQAGEDCYNSGDLDGALANLRKAASADETDECLILMAECYRLQGNYEKALELLRKMNVNDPDISARIAQVEDERSKYSSGEQVVIAGMFYPVTSSSLVLDGQKLGNAILSEVTRLYSLSELSLQDNNLTDIAPLEVLGGLNTLNIADNRITDLTPLKSLSSLRTLYIDNNPVADLSPLYQLSNLSTLSIKGIDISQNQLEELSAALPGCAIHSEEADEDVVEYTLGGVTFRSDAVELDLSGLGIRDIGVLSNCKELIRLSLSQNEVIDLSPLMDLPKLAYLDISNNAVSDIRVLMGLKTLTYINANYNDISSIASFGALSSLTELHLDGNRVKDLKNLKKLEYLETLTLSDCGLKDEYLTGLYGMDSLRLVEIYDNPDLSGDAVNALAENIPQSMLRHSELNYMVSIGSVTARSDVEELNLAGQGLVDLSALTSFTKVRRLVLSNNDIQSVHMVPYCGELEELDLSNNRISDLSPLANIQTLKKLNVSNNPVNSVSALVAMTWLEELRVSGCGLTEEQLQQLYSALPACTIYA